MHVSFTPTNQAIMPGLGMADTLQYVHGIYQNEYGILHTRGEKRVIKTDMSHIMRIPTTCKCENKDADQLRDNHQADQRLCFRYSDSTIPLLPKSEFSSF